MSEKKAEIVKAQLALVDAVQTLIELGVPAKEIVEAVQFLAEQARA